MEHTVFVPMLRKTQHQALILPHLDGPEGLVVLKGEDTAIDYRSLRELPNTLGDLATETVSPLPDIINGYFDRG